MNRDLKSRQTGNQEKKVLTDVCTAERGGVVDTVRSTRPSSGKIDIRKKDRERERQPAKVREGCR